jgi:hypothetical protein
MTEEVIAFNVTILDSDDVERSGLEIVFDGTRVFFRDSEGVEYEKQTLRSANFLVQPMRAARIMHKYGG